MDKGNSPEHYRNLSLQYALGNVGGKSKCTQKKNYKSRNAGLQENGGRAELPKESAAKITKPPSDVSSKEKTQQQSLFGTFKTMTLMNCIKECGRLRRVMYGKMIAEQKKAATVAIQPATEEPIHE